MANPGTDDSSSQYHTYVDDQPINAAYHTYIDDRPVGADSDLLWQGTPIIAEIWRIAEQIVMPLRAGLASENAGNAGHADAGSRASSRSMTFAVHGSWGMGKSSVLNMIESAAMWRAARGGSAEQLRFCHYQAPAFASARTDVRVTLAYRMLCAMAGSPREAIRYLLSDFLTVGDINRYVPKGNSQDSALKDTMILQRLATNFASLIDYDAVMRGWLDNPEQGFNRVMVVTIDDLDRCDPSFVWEILEAIQQFNDTPNLFFILGVAKDLLIESVRQHLGAFVAHTADSEFNPDYALEKYVQHAIDLPPLEGAILEQYIKKLLDEHTNDERYKDACCLNVPLIQGPLVVVTPRSIKRCLNYIAPDVKGSLGELDASVAPTDEAVQLVLKEQMVRYVWPDFYRLLFQPAVRRQAPGAQVAFRRLEEICKEQVGRPNEAQFRFSIGEFAEVYRLKLSKMGIDITTDAGAESALRLASYLGLPPFWLLDNPNYAAGGEGGAGSAATGATGGAGGQGKAGIVGVGLATNKSDLGAGSMDMLNQFLRFYVASERGYEEGNAAASLQAARQLYALVSQNQAAFDRDRAGQVGNIAINAERFRDFDLAVKLYELALVLNPEHSNNLQNYADLIITTPLPTLYDRADELLAQLNLPQHRDHRPERTLALEAQLRNRRGQPEESSDDNAAQVQALIDTFLADPTNVQRYIGLMSLLTQLSDFPSMRRISATMYRQANDDYSRYIPLRAYADTLAASPDVDNELQAMDIYRYILANFSGPQVEEYRSSILQNFATLLYKHDYDPEAGEMWFQAYQLEPSNTSIRNAYSLYLIRANRSDVADLVVAGKPLTEVVKQPQIKRVPDRYWNGTDRWWENSGFTTASLN